MSCGDDEYRARADSQRETWRKLVVGMDCRVFIGRGAEQRNDDEVLLDADDGYNGLPEKVRQMCKWALERGYDHVFKTDDDCFVEPGRLLAAVPVRHDWVGRVRGPSGGWPYPYISGFGYWMSRRAMEHRVNDEQPNDVAEDRAMGTIMGRAGILPRADHRYVVCHSSYNISSHKEAPRRGNSIIAACEFSPEEMHRVYWEWLTKRSELPSSALERGTPFDKIDVLVKTFLRDKMMMRCIDRIQQFMPGARVVVVDDGLSEHSKVRYYADLSRKGHSCVWMPFDSGFGAKSNEAKFHYERPFVLVYSDDFDCDADTADGVLRMLRVMEKDPEIGSVGGRVDNGAYEADIVEEQAGSLKRIMLVQPSKPIIRDGDLEYRYCDQTVNYNLVRREALQDAVWDEKYKIGGDHLLFYQQILAAGWKVAWCNANVRQMNPVQGDVHPAYGVARGRARMALPDLFDKCGWASFTSLDGRVDTRESVQRWYDDNKVLLMPLLGEDGEKVATKKGLRLLAKKERIKARKERAEKDERGQRPRPPHTQHRGR